MELHEFHLEHASPSLKVYAAFFTDITSGAFLQSQLVASNTAFDFAFIDASTLLSTRQLQAAIFAALSAAETSTLKTKNIHSEIVFSLSPNRSISEALRRFGVTTTSRAVVVVKIHDSEAAETFSKEELWRHWTDNIGGKAVPITNENIQLLSDLHKIKGYYKLNGAAAMERVKGDDDATRKVAEGLALGAMALRGL